MYLIRWTDTALAELAAIWNAAPASDDGLLTWAISDLIYLLRRDPETLGESRTRNTRVVFSRPLGVLFDVTDGTVWIHAVWRRG